MGNQVIINLEHVSKSFDSAERQIPVLKDMSLSIYKGDFSIILGPSGSGKSTLLHTLLGLEVPTTGKVELLNQNIYANWDEDQRSEFRKRYIGMVYQQSNWIQSLSVIDNITFPLLLLGIDKETAKQKGMTLLQNISMEKWADFSPTELSSGEQQKIALMRAIITDPDIIVADEPTGNLDYQSGEELMELLQMFNNKGKTIIMVTHDLAYIKYAKRTIKIFDGTIMGMFQRNTAQEDETIRESKRKSGTESQQLEQGSRHIKVQDFKEEPIPEKYASPEEPPPNLLKRLFQFILTIVVWIFVAVINLLINIINLPLRLFHSHKLIKVIKVDMNYVTNGVLHGISFLIMLFFSIINITIRAILSIKILKYIGANQLQYIRKQISKGLKFIFDRKIPGKIGRETVINLSYSNLHAKRSRTFVTIGGIMIGVGMIVFLVSLGYGLQSLVISRVAKLGAIKEASVSIQTGSKLQINDSTLYKLKSIPNVTNVYPIISVVGKVNYNNSNSDMAVYGVTTGYLKSLSINPINGKFFNNNNLTNKLPVETQQQSAQQGSSTTSNSIPGNQTGNGSLPFINVPSLSTPVQTPKTTIVSLLSSSNDTVVNQAMLTELGIPAQKAIGKTFQASFIVTSNLLSNTNQSIQTKPITFKIVGVLPGTATPDIYIPFIDLRSIGITDYSQLEVVVSQASQLALVRKQIESYGYATTSVADTVSQINGVFNTLRIILALFGFIALIVAALGMLNTLTISLLERTREVGLMKALGMQSSEVMELFLTESMVMSVLGGILGIIFGYVIGKILSLLLSIISVSKGGGYINISTIPWNMVILVIILSVIVGGITGIYPAVRTRRISALNALRYE